MNDAFIVEKLTLVFMEKNCLILLEFEQLTKPLRCNH